MTAPLFQIVGWAENFESGKSKHIDACTHCYTPNKHSGMGFLYIMMEAEGSAIYGIWSLIRELCSRQKKNVRAGWLTHDGRETGRPYSDEDLARMFRRPVAEIQHCLQVCCRPEVGYLKVVSGAAQYLPDIPARPQPDPRPTPAVSLEKNVGVDNEAFTEGYHEDNARPPHDPRGIPLTRDNITERKSSRACARVREEGAADPDLIQHAELKRLISDLVLVAFDRKVTEADWSNPEKDHWLDEALPLTRGDWLAVDWLYRLPIDHEVWQRTGRCNSFEGFLDHLKREIDKGKTQRKRMGLNGARAGAPKVEEPEPEGWKDAALALYGEAISLPQFFRDFPQSSRDEILGVLQKI